MKNELEQAREAATIKCDHEWLTSYLIPRCRKCGHTEHTILCLNQGIRQGFDAGRKFGSSEQAAEIERLKGFITALKAINKLVGELNVEQSNFDKRLKESIQSDGTESRKYGIRWGQRDVTRDIHRRLTGLLKWHSVTSEALAEQENDKGSEK